VQGDFHINDWLVQPQINSVERGGKTWHLEPKVMQVLVHLASHPNEVLSKDRLLEAVWHDTFVGDDVLIRCISEIRYVFGDDPKSSKIIQTIPKGGYRLIAPVTVINQEAVPQTIPHSAADEQHTQKAHELVFRYDYDLSNPKEARTPIADEPSTSPPNGQPHSDEAQPYPLIDTDQPTHAHPPHEEHTAVPAHGSSRHRLWSIIASTSLIVVLIALGGAYAWQSMHRSAVDFFWGPVINSSDPVLFCIADQGQYASLTLRDAADPTHQIVLKDNLTAVVIDDLNAVVQITGILQSNQKKYSLKGEGATNLTDLRAGPTIFVGAFDNAWTLRLTKSLRYHFYNNPEMTQLGIVDSNSPAAHTPWVVDRLEQMTTNNYRDYAIIARFIDSNTGKMAVVVAGVGRGGTIAAGELITDPTYLAQLASAARAAGNKKNMEVVLSTPIIDGEPGSPKVEATYFW
jgi:DNA-binding winged helix-turn-helix (wHTH) protein